MTLAEVRAVTSALAEGVGMAVGALRANKVRAALTILGVAIGVTVVMAMAATISGINRSIADILEQSGPKTFYVFRFFEGGVVVSDGSEENSPWRRNPPLTTAEAGVLRRLPSVAAVTVDEGTNASAEAGRSEVASVQIAGRSASWREVEGGDVYPGRSYTALEEAAGEKVAVINEKLAKSLFGARDPIGQKIKIGGQDYLVLGVYLPPPNLFAAGSGPTAIIPHETLRRHVRYWPGWASFTVRARESATLSGALDDVTAALRGARGLRPSEENTFAVVTQDKLLDVWNRMTGMFFMVMIALSSVGLMVGGVGVVAIMMISVTERTREIGVRKALGATRRAILWQFLVEAATLTTIGGAIGMALGGLIAFALARWTPVPASVPAWAIVVALAASALTGVGFGIFPANRAALMDPVEALRYE